MALATASAFGDESFSTTAAPQFDYQVLEDGTIEITKYLGNDEEVIIPKEIDGKSVTSIGDYVFYECTSLTSICIPESVTSIGNRTFYGCTSLTSICIPESVTSIGNRTFYGCTSLTSICIPESVTSIGDYVFYECTSLTSICIPESVTSIGDYVFYECISLKDIYYAASEEQWFKIAEDSTIPISTVIHYGS